MIKEIRSKLVLNNKICQKKSSKIKNYQSKNLSFIYFSDDRSLKLMTICPGQDVKRYPSGVQLDSQNVICAQGPRTKILSAFFVIQ